MKVWALTLFVMASMLSCTQQQAPTTSAPTPTPAVTATPTPVAAFMLAWEQNHAERAGWTAELTKDTKDMLPSFNGAKDMTDFCPKWASLNDDQKSQAAAIIMEWIAYYESDWKPDVIGHVPNKDGSVPTAIGLFQMGVDDPGYYDIPGTYTQADLQNPLTNIKLATQIMKMQLDHAHLLAIPLAQRKGTYYFWETMLVGSSGDQSANIKAKVKASDTCK